MKMLAINGRFLGRRLTGVDRFALEVVRALDEQLAAGVPELAGIKVRLLLPPGCPMPPAFKQIKVEYVGRRGGQLWEQWDLPRAVAADELLLSLCNTAPLLRRKQVVVIHDAATEAVPQAFSTGFRLWYRVLMPLLGRRALRVATVSEFSRSELQRAYGISPHKIDVVVEGGEHIRREPAGSDALSRFGLSGRPYLLAVSSMAAHKNFRLVLEALSMMAEPPFDVVIAGGANAKVFGDAGKVDDERIHWLGYVSDGELAALYQQAWAFVFPSIYEGFGIPPLEAMQWGCPVVAARAASIPEVCGDAALYFDPRNAGELVAALQRLAADDRLRQHLSDEGRKRAALFSWPQAARQVADVCRRALEEA